MPGTWIFALVLFVIAAIGVFAAIFGRATHNGDSLLGGIGTALLAGLIGVVFTVVSAYARVDTRNVGIVTKFGNPVGVRSAGLAWHKPWEQLSELSEAIQLQAFESTSYGDADVGKSTGNPGVVGPAVKVRFANNSTGYVNENLNWRLSEGAAPKLFQDYGGATKDVFDTIKNQLVDRQAQVIVAKVFATFNPQLPGQAADLAVRAIEVKNDLQQALLAPNGTQEIEVLDVRIPGFFVDPATQGRIDDNNKKVQETLNAAQDVKTAEQQRLAAEQRASQAPPDLRIAISNCINAASADHRDASGCFGQIGGTPLVQLPRS